MADDKGYKSFDSEKTVVLRPGAGAGAKTELYNPGQASQTGYANQHSVLDATVALDAQPDHGATIPAARSHQAVADQAGTLRITPQTPHGSAAPPTQAVPPAEAGYTRVIRPSVSAPSEAAAAPKAAAGPAASSAAADLAIVLKEGPVVGWLVVIGGPGKGLCRPVYYGNNTLGRDNGQRVPINFGDDAISAEEQAYIRYDSQERKYLLIPNLAKSNLVAVNDTRPTERVVLAYGDVIGVGQTRLMFIPLCGADFDWADVEAQ